VKFLVFTIFMAFTYLFMAFTYHLHIIYNNHTMYDDIFTK